MPPWDGNKTMELTRLAEQVSGGNHPKILDTLAAAYAEAGQFDRAVESAKRALNLFAAQNNGSLAGAVQVRLKLYEAGIPFRDTSQTSPPARPTRP